MKTLSILLVVAALLMSCTQHPVAIINTNGGESIVLNTGGSVMTKAKYSSGTITHGATSLSYEVFDKDETVVPVASIKAKASTKAIEAVAPRLLDGVKAVVK